MLHYPRWGPLSSPGNLVRNADLRLAPDYASESAFFKQINLFIFIYLLFLAALGLCCCTRAFSSCGERGLLFVVVRGLLIAVASLVAEHGL